jgi:hypothetical protein
VKQGVSHDNPTGIVQRMDILSVSYEMMRWLSIPHNLDSQRQLTLVAFEDGPKIED